ncbi:TetR/AcrR family transcriptional regulator [Primorskyibacter sp. 2E233]|uniref:TetR/AcrR family transcriptional regulator n=1 Tax=Primorskyibacter sp. 2E233 TaxID=3413431 RepID=UPI003BF068A6
MPRKTPLQSRSRASYEAIVTAAAQVLEHGGMAALTTNLVAERAGVSIGSLYQYFPNKDAIAAELVRRQMAQMREDIADAMRRCDGKDLQATVWIILKASIRHHARAPKLSRILEEAEKTLPLDGETRQSKALVHAQLTEVLSNHYVPEPETAATDLSGMTAGMVHAALAAGETDTDALAERAYRAVCGYLDLPLPKRDADELPDQSPSLA